MKKFVKKYFLVFIFLSHGLFSIVPDHAVKPKERIPLMNRNGRPYCLLTIQDKEYEALFDLGNWQTEIDVSVLPINSYQLLPAQTSSLKGPKGEREISQLVQIKGMQVGPLILSDFQAVVKEKKDLSYSINFYSEEPQEAKSTISKNDPPCIMGHSVFRNQTILIDLPHSSLIVYEKGEFDTALLKNWIEVPFTDETTGCVAIQFLDRLCPSCSEEMSFFVLDTGSSVNIIYNASVEPSSRLVLKRIPFGPLYTDNQCISVGTHAYELNQPGVKGIKGLLGIPFFAKKPVLIDFFNQKIFFPSEEKEANFPFSYLQETTKLPKNWAEGLLP